ncbi:hypothetical protein HY629_01805 [Candidatus Uhrbacteria bacterium]|nr:hypothetical protein [Candidatus Uhrbacteria bacterium]
MSMQRLSRLMQGGGVRSVLFSLLFSLFFVAVSVSAASTISSNISTDGTLSVTGVSTLTGRTTMGYASSTGQSLTGNLIVGGRATTTGSNGNFETRGTIYASSSALFTGTVLTYGDATLGDAASDTITITGLTSMGYASSTGISLALGGGANNLMVGGFATVTTNGNFATRGTIAASSTSLFTGAVTTYGSDTFGDAQADTLTINGGTITLGNAATTTIVNTFPGAWSIATSSAIIPFVRFDTTNYRFGIATSAPGRMFSVNGGAVFTGDVDVVGTFTPAQTTATTFTVTGLTTLSGNASTTQLSAVGRIYVGGTASSTIRGDNVASTLPYASSTAITTTGSAFLATTGGSVGVGTTTPGASFSVEGHALIGGTATIGVISATSTLSVTGATTLSSTLGVTGVSTFTGRADLNGQASTTRLSAFDRIYVGGTASSTIRGDNVASELPYASSTSMTWTGTASTSVLRVGGFDGANGTLAGMIFGTCDIAQTSIVASTTAFRNCSSATGISTAYKVFVQATSSLGANLASPSNGFIIVSASSTAANTISVELSNLTGAANIPTGTLNFWAVR